MKSVAKDLKAAMAKQGSIPMEGVHECAEGYPVFFGTIEQTRVGSHLELPPEGTPVVQAFNDGGFNCTVVNLPQLIAWVREHHPELLED